MHYSEQSWSARDQGREGEGWSWRCVSEGGHVFSSLLPGQRATPPKLQAYVATARKRPSLQRTGVARVWGQRASMWFLTHSAVGDAPSLGRPCSEGPGLRAGRSPVPAQGWQDSTLSPSSPLSCLPAAPARVCEGRQEGYMAPSTGPGPVLSGQPVVTRAGAHVGPSPRRQCVRS